MEFVQLKSKKPQKTNKQDIRGLLLLAVCLLGFYCLLFPHNSGVLGSKFAITTYLIFGYAAYVLLFFCSLWSIRVLLNIFPEKPLREAIGHFLFFVTVSVILALWGPQPGRSGYGGVVGGFIASNLLIYPFSLAGAYLLVVISFVLALTLSTEFSLPEFIAWLGNKISADWQEWQEAKKRQMQTRSTRPPVIVRNRDIVRREREPVASAVTNKPELSPQIVEEKNDKKEEKVKDKKEGSFIAGIIPRKKEKPKEPEKEKVVPVPQKEFVLPSLDLLDDIIQPEIDLKEENLREKAQFLEKTLADFGIIAKVIEINPGPVITRYDLQPAAGVKVQSIVSLSNDIALAMKAPTIRVLAPIPGKAAVGIEIPNLQTHTVGLKEILASEEFKKNDSKLIIALGKTTAGEPYVADLTPMPHLLIAGATGSGKSVCIHSLITSILYKAKPDEVKFLMIDPKRLELALYNKIPHLYNPDKSPAEVEVITNAKEAAKSLIKMVKVMEYRYQKFAQASVRNIEGYNLVMEKTGKPKEFYVIIIIDELADLMLIASREVEESITRLAQMSRAVGIHLVLATQRPSVDIITGVIKANLPARIAFQVLSKTDSRVILDTLGADDLLGRGDMLFLATGAPKPIRLQGAYVSEKEVEKVVNFVAEQGRSEYPEIFPKTKRETVGSNEELDELLTHALLLTKQLQRVSSDILRGDEKIGHKYAIVLGRMERDGFVYKPEGARSWKINIEKIDEYLNSLNVVTSNEQK